MIWDSYGSNMEKKLFFKTAQNTGLFPNSQNENKKEESKILWTKKKTETEQKTQTQKQNKNQSQQTKHVIWVMLVFTSYFCWCNLLPENIALSAWGNVSTYSEKSLTTGSFFVHEESYLLQQHSWIFYLWVLQGKHIY